VGKELFQTLFVDTIQSSFILAGSTALLDGCDLKLTFITPRQFLNLPLEFLNDGSDYLVLRYPMKRLVTGIHTRANLGIADLLAELQGKHEKLQILLVASNTKPAIDNVDNEGEELYENLKTTVATNRVSIDYLPTEQATYDEILNRLKGCKYHIVHYAGHASHHQSSPEKSSLYFWEKRYRQGTRKALPVNILRNTLRMQGHNLRFVYLSCCSGAATSDQEALLSDNFLGLADGLLLAGVPAVLGFRWPVSDRGARELALSFYDSLFEQCALDTALFNARCKVEGIQESQSPISWLSPVLVAQG
jgi:CHAT domain-containing protein